MPGKVNPSQCESLAMIATRVIGNDATITLAGASGHLQLNAYKPVMIYTLLESIELLSDGCKSFETRCIRGITANTSTLEENVSKSLMLATALNPLLGYDKTASIVKKAYESDLTLKAAAIELNLLSAEEFDELVDPRSMI